MEHTGSEIENEVYYLKEAEFKLLLAGLGLKEWYGLFSEEVSQPAASAQEAASDETVNRMLAELFQKGVVDWKGKGVVLRQPYAKMFAAMLEKKRCITMQIPGSDIPVRCGYLAEKEMVVMHKSQREDAAVGISQMSVESWLALAAEEADRMKEGACLELVCRSSENGSIYRKLQVRQEGVRGRRIDWENGSVHCFQKELKEKLGELLC